MRFLAILLLLIIIAMSIYGVYHYYQSYKPALDKYSELVSENKTLAEYISRLRSDQMKKDSVLSILANTKNEVDTQIIFDNITGTRITLESENLFESGGYVLNKKGKGLLKKTAEVLLKMSDAEIVIEGHTDNQKIGPSIKSLIPSNWELSALRAINVMKYLRDSLGIVEKRMYVAAYGETRPIADNSTEDGRKKNRRIEIFLKSSSFNKIVEDTIE
ncbi:MAG: flagellar motor protein MotB [bacterium]|nr:flagellar motor protein MotB [bacterium]